MGVRDCDLGEKVSTTCERQSRSIDIIDLLNADIDFFSDVTDRGGSSVIVISAERYSQRGKGNQLRSIISNFLRCNASGWRVT